MRFFSKLLNFYAKSYQKQQSHKSQQKFAVSLKKDIVSEGLTFESRSTHFFIQYFFRKIRLLSLCHEIDQKSTQNLESFLKVLNFKLRKNAKLIDQNQSNKPFPGRSVWYYKMFIFDPGV